MSTTNVPTTLELILNNLLSTNADAKITLYLNSPNKTELISVDTNFSLSVSGNCSIDGITTSSNTTLDVLCNANFPLDIKSVGTIAIPELKINGNTEEQELPLTLTLTGDHTFDLRGTAEGILPKLNIDTVIPSQNVILPIQGEAKGNLDLNVSSILEIPPLVVKGKTNSNSVAVTVIGSTAEDLKVHGIVTGIIPQLKVSGTTSRSKLDLDLEGNTSADLTVAQVDELERIALDRLDLRNMPLRRHTGTNKRNIKLRIVGKASGFLDPLSVDGLTAAEAISLPVFEDSSCSFSIISSGEVMIPELDIDLKTVPHETKITSAITQEVSLNIFGNATGNIPETKVTAQTDETVILSTITGVSAGTVTLNSSEELLILSVSINGTTQETTVPLEVVSNININHQIAGTASGKISPTKVTGIGEIVNLPVSGKIETNPNFISVQPNFNGYISSVESGLILLREDSTNNLLTLDIDSISYVSFETESSIISPNKFSYINSNNNLEKGLINTWYKDTSINLYGSNTTNPLNKIIKTDDIKYINKGVMWTEEYVVGGILNTIYSIDRLIGFSLLN